MLYFKQAWNLLRQERLFSLIYILGTGLSISMVMVLAIVYHVKTAEMEPEVHRHRTLYLSTNRYKYNEGKSTNAYHYSALAAQECLLPLQTAEAVSVSASPLSLQATIGDFFVRLPGKEDLIQADVRATNDGFWRVFRFRFLQGKPYSAEEFVSGIPTAVLSETLARRIFGETEIVGQHILLNDVDYRISGVVKDVFAHMFSSYAEVWIPYTTLSEINEGWKNRQDPVTGPLEACVLARQSSDFERIGKELKSLCRKFNTSLPTGEMEPNPPFTLLEQIVLTYNSTATTAVGWDFGVLAFLFLLIPALNLSGLNALRMQERMPEVGVRKAFGARTFSLFLQVFRENLLLMFPGVLLGLLFSYLIVFLLHNILFALGMLALMAGIEVRLAPSMLINRSIFGYACLACLLLNLLSSFLPVYRATRVRIIEAIHSN